MPFIILSHASAAEDTGGAVESVVIEARKTAEDSQTVPGSVSVLTGADLQSAGIGDFEELTQIVPNVSMSGGIAGVLQGEIGIRGISTLVRNIGVESGVGYYVDGVYQGRPENYNQELIDIAHADILRGPQGTIFGKNTIAGAFDIVTVRPEADAPHMLLNAEFGNYGLARVRGYVTGPLAGDTLAGKLSLGYVTRGGVYEHLSSGPDADTLDQLSYRTSFYYTPTPDSEFVLTADGLHDRGRAAFFQVTDLWGASTPNELAQETTPHRIDNNRPDYLYRDNYGLSLTGRQKFAAGTLTSITAYRQSAYQASLDDDQNQVDYTGIDQWSDHNSFWSQELRFNGALGDRADYVAGFYYLGQSLATNRNIGLGADLGVPGMPVLTTRGHVSSSDYSAYGNLNYRLTDALAVSLGLRVSEEDKSVGFWQNDPSGFYTMIGYPALSYENSVSNRDVSPTGTVSYQITPEAMAYVRIARGFKSAAFNVDIIHNNYGLSAGPESATSYEAGIKSDLFGRRLRLNAAVFRTNYDDMQVSQLLGSAAILTNAASATIDGAEIEATGFVTRDLRVYLGLGALDARYDDFQKCGIPDSLGGGWTDCSGKRIIGAPDWTADAGVQYSRTTAYGEILARLDYQFEAPVYYEASNAKRFESDSHNIFNLRTGLDRGNYAVFLWVKNLLDETYVTYADDRSALGVLKTTAYGLPRTFGISVSLHY